MENSHNHRNKVILTDHLNKAIDQKFYELMAFINRRVVTGSNDSIVATAAGIAANCYKIKNKFNNISVCATTNDALMAPRAIINNEFFLRNSGAADARFFPDAGSNFETLSADAYMAITAGDYYHFFCIKAGTWSFK